MSTKRKLKNPTSQDVIDYLKGVKEAEGTFASEEELDAAVQAVTKPLDINVLSEEDQAILLGSNEQAKTVVPDEERPDTPMPLEMDLPDTSEANDFMMELNEYLSVTVSDDEKDLYIKSLLNDTPFKLEVEPFPGFKVVVRARTVFFDDLIYDMVRQSSDNGEIIGMESGFTKLMRLLAAVQIESVQGRNIAFDISKTENREEVSARLLQHSKNVFDSYTLTKWNAIVKAVRVFDAKNKICNDKLLDKSFW